MKTSPRSGAATRAAWHSAGKASSTLAAPQAWLALPAHLDASQRAYDQKTYQGYRMFVPATSMTQTCAFRTRIITQCGVWTSRAQGSRAVVGDTWPQKQAEPASTWNA